MPAAIWRSSLKLTKRCPSSGESRYLLNVRCEEQSMADVNAHVKNFILSEFLPGENPENLTNLTPLITSGVLDSLATLKMVAHLEETYGVQFEAHEMDASNLNTLSNIANLVRAKMQTR